MFKLTITSIDKVLFRGLVSFLICPGKEGELTVLKNHVPLITPLKTGEIRVTIEEEKKNFLIERGFLVVHKTEAIILV